MAEVASYCYVFTSYSALPLKRSPSLISSSKIRVNHRFQRITCCSKSVSTVDNNEGKSDVKKRSIRRRRRPEGEKKSQEYKNGDPLGRRDLGKLVVRWIGEGMRAMASDFAAAEVQGEFGELEQRLGPGLTFLMAAQPYLSAVPMPPGLEAVCLKACTHYPTLFDHFQRELRGVLQGLQGKSVVEDWRETWSWKTLKQLANSGPFFFFVGPRNSVPFLLTTFSYFVIILHTPLKQLISLRYAINM